MFFFKKKKNSVLMKRRKKNPKKISKCTLFNKKKWSKECVGFASSIAFFLPLFKSLFIEIGTLTIENKTNRFFLSQL